MARHKRSPSSQRRAVVGAGGFVSTILNKAVDLIPFEAHLPGYNYCGPGTKLSKRLARGDKGINGLDEACKLHDIAYSKYSDSEHRKRADQDLAERAWQRFKASDSSLAEKTAAWAVTTAMKAKTKLGGGCKRAVTGSGRRGGGGIVRKKKKKSSSSSRTAGGGLYLRPFPKQGAGKIRRSGSRRRRRRVQSKKKR